MLRPVRPQMSDQGATELFGPDDEATKGEGEGKDEWDEVLEAVEEDKGADDDLCKPCSEDEGLHLRPCKGSVDLADGEWETIQLAQGPVPLADIKIHRVQRCQDTT